MMKSLTGCMKRPYGELKTRILSRRVLCVDYTFFCRLGFLERWSFSLVGSRQAYMYKQGTWRTTPRGITNEELDTSIWNKEHMLYSVSASEKMFGSASQAPHNKIVCMIPNP